MEDLKSIGQSDQSSLKHDEEKNPKNKKWSYIIGALVVVLGVGAYLFTGTDLFKGFIGIEKSDEPAECLEYKADEIHVGDSVDFKVKEGCEVEFAVDEGYGELSVSGQDEATGGEATANHSYITSLEATALDSAVHLEWSEEDNTGVKGYTIYYGLNSVAAYWQKYDFDIDVGDVLEYTMTGLQNGTTYYFSVVAYDEEGNESSIWAPEASATPSVAPQVETVEIIEEITIAEEALETAATILEKAEVKVEISEDVGDTSESAISALENALEALNAALDKATADGMDQDVINAIKLAIEKVEEALNAARAVNDTEPAEDTEGAEEEITTKDPKTEDAKKIEEATTGGGASIILPNVIPAGETPKKGAESAGKTSVFQSSSSETGLTQSTSPATEPTKTAVEPSTEEIPEDEIPAYYANLNGVADLINPIIAKEGDTVTIKGIKAGKRVFHIRFNEQQWNLDILEKVEGEEDVEEEEEEVTVDSILAAMEKDGDVCALAKQPKIDIEVVSDGYDSFVTLKEYVVKAGESVEIEDPTENGDGYSMYKSPSQGTLEIEEGGLSYVADEDYEGEDSVILVRSRIETETKTKDETKDEGTTEVVQVPDTETSILEEFSGDLMNVDHINLYCFSEAVPAADDDDDDADDDDDDAAIITTTTTPTDTQPTVVAPPSGGGGGGGGGGSLIRRKKAADQPDIKIKSEDLSLDKITDIFDCLKENADPAEFEDSNDKAVEFISSIKYGSEPIVKGYVEDGDTFYEGDEKATRAEILKVMMVSSCTPYNVQFGEDMKFKDVSDEDWFNNFVHSAREQNIVEGFEGNVYKPNNYTTRAEALKMLAVMGGDQIEKAPESYELKIADVDKNHWAYDVIKDAEYNNIVVGKQVGIQTLFFPDKEITRYEMATLIYNFYNALLEKN